MSRAEIEALFAELKKELREEISAVRDELTDHDIDGLAQRLSDLEDTVDNAVHESWRRES